MMDIFEALKKVSILYTNLKNNNKKTKTIVSLPMISKTEGITYKWTNVVITLTHFSFTDGV